MTTGKDSSWPPSNLNDVLDGLNQAAKGHAMTDKHPLSDELRKLARAAIRGEPTLVYNALYQAADALDERHRNSQGWQTKSEEHWKARLAAEAERDFLKQRLDETKQALKLLSDTAERWHAQLEQKEIVQANFEEAKGELRKALARAEAAEGREVGLREMLERISEGSECDDAKLLCRNDHDRNVCPTIAARKALSQHAEPPLLQEVRRYREALEWYAGEAWKTRDNMGMLYAPIERDGGQRAREALHAHEKAAGEGEG